MTWPALRIEGNLVIGRVSSQVLSSRRRHALNRIVCMLKGHDWSPWTIDDYEGPGQWMSEEDFMPFFSRNSRANEYGIRVCRRSCGTSETRYPIDQAPRGWIQRLRTK
jgi:hypothetical protein